MKKNTAALMAMTLCLLILSACGARQKDDAQRYVVLSPEVAEILAALGIEDRIVGLTTECTYPPALADIPKVGAFGAVKLESVISLNPGIVFVSGLEQDGLAQDLSRLGFRVERVYPESAAGILSEITRIGEITDSEDAAKTLVLNMKAEMDSIRAANSGKSSPRVYLEIYRDPLMSVADNSFVGELIEIAGGDNVFDRLERDYSRVKAEDVILAKPDIIICYSQDSLANILSRKGWQVIPAIQNGMIFFEEDLDPDLIQRAGPRVIEGLRGLSALYDQWREKVR